MANPDSYSFNPFQTKKQRGQTEVRMLLEKCPPETIALDPTLLAKLDQDKVEEFDEEKLKRVGFKPDRNFDVKVKKRGRSKAGNKEVRKRKMREQAMQKSGHLDKKRQEKVQKFKQEKAKRHSSHLCRSSCHRDWLGETHLSGQPAHHPAGG